MAEMLVDPPATLRGDRNQDLDIAHLAGERREFGLLGGNLRLAMHLDLGLICLAGFKIVIDVHIARFFRW